MTKTQNQIIIILINNAQRRDLHLHNNEKFRNVLAMYSIQPHMYMLRSHGFSTFLVIFYENAFTKSKKTNSGALALPDPYIASAMHFVLRHIYVAVPVPMLQDTSTR